MSWKPIDTAPRNGREIVVAYRRPRNAEVIVAVSVFEAGGWRRSEESLQDAVLSVGDVPFAWIDKPE